MKLILEEETTEKIEGEDVKTISKVKECKDLNEVLSSKVKGKKQYVHTCYHDEGKGRPCRRELI